MKTCFSQVVQAPATAPALPHNLRVISRLKTAAMIAGLTGLVVVGLGLGSSPMAVAQEAPQLETVARFDHQVTGVAVSQKGRVFVNFPRWTEDAPISVAEVLPGGRLQAFPDAQWNAWRNAKRDQMTPQDHWVCVQSVVMDAQDNLWVLDPGAPAQGPVVAGAPKLVKIDLKTNQIAQTIAFDEKAAPQGSYLNDVRFSPEGHYAYLTDSGAQGALLIVDLAKSQTRRLLAGHPSTQAEKNVMVKAEGEVLRRPDGRGVEFAADGIALSPDGRYLYWQAIKGRSLYRIDTAALQAANLSSDNLAAKVEQVGENGPADGLWMDSQGRMYISAIEENAIKVRQGNQVQTLLQNRRLRWPDSFAQGPDGALYVTSSRIQDMNWFKPDNPSSLRTTLFRFFPNP